MEFRILGQLEVLSGDRRLGLGGHRQRAVLAVLLLQRDRVVPVERLIDLLWDGRPPAQAVGTLRAYLSNLRRILEPDRGAGRPPEVLVSETGGYALRAGAEQVDATRFEGLVREARQATTAGDAPAKIATLLRTALDEWRGPALADFPDEPFAWAEAARLEELRLSAVEEHTEAALACGQAAAVAADLEPLVAAHPLRERLRGQLMLALYRCGRQADALRVYEAGRRLLADELGLDPSPALRAVESAILVQDPALGASAALPRPPPRPSLVGRDHEIGVLQARLADVLAGRGQVVLLAGEPGIGKSRLAEAAAELATAAGATAATGAAIEDGGAPAFWPWVLVVRRLLELRPADEVRGALGGRAGELVRIVPEVAGVVGSLDASPVAADPELARFRVYDALTQFILRVARAEPLAVILEDLQWADVPSLQLVTFLAGAVKDAPVLIVATYRDAEADLPPALASALSRLVREPHVTRLALPGLTEQDIARLAGPESPAPGEIVTAVHRRTDGNPLFAIALLQLYREGGPLDSVPATVRDVVRHHLNRLGAPTRDLLAAASVAGHEFDVGLVAEVVEYDAARALRCAEEAVAAGLLAEGAGLGRFRFSHAVTRDTVYDSLTSLRRAQLHERFGAAIEARHGAGRPDAIGDLAHHYQHAAALGSVAKAIHYAEAAADAAQAGLAFEDAERQLLTALDLVARQPAGADAARLELRLRMKLGTLRFTTRGYSDASVLPVLTRVLDLSRDVGSRHERLVALWGGWGYAIGQPDLPLARKLGEELLDEGQRAPDDLYLVAGHAAIGMAALHEGDLATAREHLRAGMAFPSDGDDDLVERLLKTDLSQIVLEKHPCVGARALGTVALYLAGEEAGALAELQAAHAFARRMGQTFGVNLVYVVEAGLHGIRDDPAPVPRVLEYGLVLARRHGFRQWESLLVGFGGWARAAQGDKDAIDEAAAAIDQLEASGNGMLLHLLLGLLAKSRWGTGDGEGALADLDRAIRFSDASGERFYEAELHRLRGEMLLELAPERAVEARGELATALAIARLQGAVPLQKRAEASLSRLQAVAP